MVFYLYYSNLLYMSFRPILLPQAQLFELENSNILKKKKRKPKFQFSNPLSFHPNDYPMTESAISSNADGILGKLGYADVRVSNGELSGVIQTIRSIKAKHGDAKEKQVNNHQIKVCLERIEDLLNEADDLVDETYNVATKFEVEEVRTSTSTSTIVLLPRQIQTISLPWGTS